jgi:hypothetical protein
MILAPASCLSTKTLRWVARDLEGRQIGHQALPANGHSAWAIAGQFADVYASDVKAPKWVG